MEYEEDTGWVATPPKNIQAARELRETMRRYGLTLDFILALYHILDECEDPYWVTATRESIEELLEELGEDL